MKKYLLIFCLTFIVGTANSKVVSPAIDDAFDFKVESDFSENSNRDIASKKSKEKPVQESTDRDPAASSQVDEQPEVKYWKY